MQRRAFIGGIATGGAGLLAGCLSADRDGGEVRGEYTVDPATTEFDYDCQEADLFDDTFRLSGKLTSRVVGHSSVEWHIDTDADRRLNVAIYSTDPRSRTKGQFPAIEIVDPNGNVVLEGRDSSNLYDIATEAEGRYVVRALSRNLTKGGNTWRVQVSWYQRAGCE